MSFVLIIKLISLNSHQVTDIVIATPGRLNDLFESKLLSLDSCSYLILDETDGMLDMGFGTQIKKVWDYYLVFATMPTIILLLYYILY